MKKIFSLGIAIVSIVFILFGCSAFDEERGNGFPCSFCGESYVGYSSSSSYWYSNISSSSSYWYSSPSSSSVGNIGSGSGNCGSYNGGNGSFSCGGQTYKTVVIGTQTWMAENLNYNISGSVCYDNSSSNCNTYGRLYNWSTAMNLPSSCNGSTCSGSVQSKHQGICPSGWHIPSDSDWATLDNYVGGSSTAGRYLKATSGWYNCSPSGSSYLCEDSYGFAALPGGNGSSGGSFNGVGDYGFWWSASEYDANSAYAWSMVYVYEYVITGNGIKSYYLFSVRCLQD